MADETGLPLAISLLESYEQGRNVSQDCRILKTRLDNLRLRLRTWGRASGLVEGYRCGDKLDEPEHRSQIAETLDSLAVLFKDSPGKMGEDGKKFNDQIKNLIEDLEDLTKLMDIPDKQRYIIKYEIESMYDLDELRDIEEAHFGDDDMVSHAASERISSFSVLDAARIRKYLFQEVSGGDEIDHPASVAVIEPFINDFQIDRSECILPTDRFRNFNGFLYRELKLGARPCAAPNGQEIMVSLADYRATVFPTAQAAQQFWVKDANSLCNALSDQHAHRKTQTDTSTVLWGGSTGDDRQEKIVRRRSTGGSTGELSIQAMDLPERPALGYIIVGGYIDNTIIITRKQGDTVEGNEELGYFKYGKSIAVPWETLAHSS
ncbi:hypothetical protein K469DRAFT_688197 [Zopfia rhizophila CBS 207.26]|uniref:Prion-inhibition and propagation HeLo domain-containing protein n=1 Tax=Zopfia rhizophila CBS 207.26 TaxID=1314779 RepID=A0A6A6DZ65_9PEZI|nr:hypothetical protein K469DRAFT_688197 [Zopfia rhizophila CBS 207.26]